MDLKFQVKLKIQKPVAEVFDGVYNPKKLSAYFTTGSASAPLDEGKTVMWDFADFPGAFPVEVKKSVPGKSLVLKWDAAGGGKNTVEFSFEAIDAGSTQVAISESGWKEDQEGLDASYMNCQGWMHMACALKAYLEYGINLRKGAF